MLHLTSMAQKLVIIDTDCGIDDALAIIVALAAPNVKIVGITCCFGNADVDNVCQNVLRVLSVCGQTQVSLISIKTVYCCLKTKTKNLHKVGCVVSPQIPVFKGSAGPLVKAVRSLKDHFGTDGLGDVLENRDSEIWMNQIQKELAVHAMIRLINENQGEVRNTL